MSLRILLADDHEIVLDGLQSVLENEPDLEIVGAVRDGQAAVTEALACRPDIVVTDISMPGMNGVESTRRILAAVPGVKVICLSVHADAAFVEALLDAGASGYLTKDCAAEELVRAIRAVAMDQVYLSPTIAAVVVNRSRVPTDSAPEPSPFPSLTDREREVLQLLAEGMSTKAIGTRLRVSAKTVGSHREHLMRKLEIHSVAGLTKYAIRHGLTSLDG